MRIYEAMQLTGSAHCNLPNSQNVKLLSAYVTHHVAHRFAPKLAGRSLSGSARRATLPVDECARWIAGRSVCDRVRRPGGVERGTSSSGSPRTRVGWCGSSPRRWASGSSTPPSWPRSPGTGCGPGSGCRMSRTNCRRRCGRGGPGHLQHRQQVGGRDHRHVRGRLLCELTGLGVPIIAVPLVKDALARHVAFGASLEVLRGMGVRVMFDPQAPPQSRMPSWPRVLAELHTVTRDEPGGRD